MKHTVNMGENDSWTGQNKTGSGAMHALRLNKGAANAKYADAVCSCAYAPVEASDEQANTPATRRGRTVHDPKHVCFLRKHLGC